MLEKTRSVTLETSDVRGYDIFATAYEAGTKVVARFRSGRFAFVARDLPGIAAVRVGSLGARRCEAPSREGGPTGTQ